jgi:hypothetical protein
MDYVFNSVEIFEFDIRVAVQPLLLPETKAVQSQCLFLVQKDNYRTQYQQKNGIRTATFKIRPLTDRVLKRNHFWRRYKEIWLNNGSPDYWRLQMPFLCKPSTTIRLNLKELELEGASIQGSVEPRIFLSALGWSVNLHFRLQGRMEPAQLVSFIGRLRNRNIYPLLVDGKEKTLGGTHGFLSDYIRNEIYSQENPPADILKLPRHLVVSISRFDGPKRLYRKRFHDKPELMEMTDEDRALIHSIVYGRPVSNEEAIEQKVSLTQFDDANFALTEFDHGTLLFMQEAAAIGSVDRSEASLKCLCWNIQTCSMMILTWLSFYEIAARYGNLSPKVQDLRNGVQHTLQELRDRYTNKVCQTFYLNYGPLQKLIASSGT